MASAGRTLGWAAPGLFIYMLVAACSGGATDRTAICGALDALGEEIATFQELLVWPGITAVPLREATEDLEADVVQVAVAAEADELVAEVVAAFRPVAEAVDDTVPARLAEARPGEPAQMAARFISVELQPLIAAHARVFEERC